MSPVDASGETTTRTRRHSSSAVYYAITRDWADDFLPDAVTVVPFPVAAVLSTALVCTLPAVWVCQRKTVAVEETPSA